MYWNVEGISQLCLSEQTIDGCIKDSICVSVRISGISNIDELFNRIYIYPNPIENESTLFLKENHSFKQALLYNMQAKSIVSYSISKNQKKISINRNGLSSGFYILKLVGLQEEKHLPVLIK